MENRIFHGNGFRYLVFSVAVCALLLIVAFIAVYSGKTNTSSAQSKIEPDKSDIKVFNEIKELQIVDSKIKGSRFLITVRNNTDKVINSFYLTTGDASYHMELLYSDVQDAVAPAADYNLFVDLDNNLKLSGVKIRAIVFEDGTGSGEPSFIQEIKDKRYGEKLELTNGKQLLENLSLSLNTNPLGKLEELKEKISSFSPSDKEREREAIKFGRNLGKQRLLRYIEDLSKNADSNNLTNLQTDITALRDKLNKFISKQ